jgi:hypothetical protein
LVSAKTTEGKPKTSTAINAVVALQGIFGLLVYGAPFSKAIASSRCLTGQPAKLVLRHPSRVSRVGAGLSPSAYGMIPKSGFRFSEKDHAHTTS